MTDPITILTLLDAMISFLIGLAANGATSAVLEARSRALKETLENEQVVRKALASRHSLSDDVRRACVELARNRNRFSISKQEEPLWALLSEQYFQDNLIEWLMAGDIEEGADCKVRLINSIELAMASSKITPQQTTFLKTDFFSALEKAIFSNAILAHWRHQLSLDYLREQVAFLRRKAEEAAGIFSDERQTAALASYCKEALSAWDIIDLSNLPEGDIHMATQKLLLRQLYMPLRIAAEQDDTVDVDATLAKMEEAREERRLWEAGRVHKGKSAPSSEKESRLSVGELLGVSKRLVVLGEPGGGKTTMLRWMATAYLLSYRHDTAFDQLPDTKTLPQKTWVPVLIRCRDLCDTHLCSCFKDFLTQHLHKSNLLPEEADVMRAVILDSLAKGTTLLLVDGLDEITNPRVRMMFCQELERTAVRYPDASIVVTSRIVGYRDMPYRMGQGFKHGVIAELSREDKDLFARHWVELTEQYQTPAERAKRVIELFDALHSNDRIARLTGNPMLLTTLALVKRKVGKLPSRRTKLYAEAVSVLLNWNPRYYTVIEEDEAIPQLECLAYEMCLRGIQRIPEDGVLEILEKARFEHPNIRAIRRREPQDFLELLEARSSILIKSGGLWEEKKTKEKPVWEFRHLTFQEYLAARALLEGRFLNRVKTKTLAEQVAVLAGAFKTVEFPSPDLEVVESWRETLRLLIADCKDDDVDAVLSAILEPLPDEDVSKSSRPRAVLAALCLADEPNVSEEIGESVLKSFAKNIQHSDILTFDEHTTLQVAGIEVLRSMWQSQLKKCVIEEYICRPSDERANVGGLWGVIEFAVYQDYYANINVWIADLLKRLNSDDRNEVLSSSLAILIAAFEGKLILVPGLVERLLNLLGTKQPECNAAAWALGWISIGSRKAKESKPLWEPNGVEVQKFLDTLANTLPSENDTRRWLIILLKNSKNPIVVDALLGELEQVDDSVCEAAVEALGFLQDSRGLTAIKRLLKDDSQRKRFAAMTILAQNRDEIEKKLLAKNLDGTSPWLDPREPINENYVVKAAGILNLPAEEIRARYKALASDFALTLSF